MTSKGEFLRKCGSFCNRSIPFWRRRHFKARRQSVSSKEIQTHKNDWHYVKVNYIHNLWKSRIILLLMLSLSSSLLLFRIRSAKVAPSWRLHIYSSKIIKSYEMKFVFLFVKNNVYCFPNFPLAWEQMMHCLLQHTF